MHSARSPLCRSRCRASSSRSNRHRRCHRNGAALVWPHGEVLGRLRLDHQVEQLRAGLEPDDYIDAADLNPVTRNYVREAFHAASLARRSLEGELALPPP
jgi:hypothetical protein